MNRFFVRRMLKAMALRIRLPAKLFLFIFFDKQYFVGRHFDEGLAGYIWAFSAIWQRNILRLAPPMPFPASSRVTISNAKNIDFHPDDINNFQSSGIYLQNFKGRIIIGRGTYIAPNVGIITANHDPENLDIHLEGKSVELGQRCWIGMNAVLLPGVVLGDNTIVGAGSVVTKSFPDGNVIVAGNPARFIRRGSSSTSVTGLLNLN